VTFNACRKNSLGKHVIRDRIKKGRVERKKEGDRRAEAEIYSGAVCNPAVRTPGL